MNILITGSSGQLGQALKNNKIKTKSYKYFFKSKNNLDVTKYKKIHEFIIKNKISVIINCAAYTNVDNAENFKIKANKINNLSVKNLSLISKKYKILLIQISTDYIFSSNKKKIFFENDLKNPKNYYGITKLRAENQILQYKPLAIIIRTSWLYSEFSNNFVKTIFNLIQKRKNIELNNNAYGSPTNANDLANFIYLTLSKKYLFIFKENVIFHYSNKGCISRYQFIKKIIEFSNIRKKIKIIKKYSSNKNLNIRPCCSCLRGKNFKIIKEFKYIKWDKSLLKCINKLNKNAKI